MISDIDCFHNNDENLINPQFHQGDKLGVWLADAREEEGVRCQNHNLLVVTIRFFVSLLSQSQFVVCFFVVTITICFFVVSNLLAEEQRQKHNCCHNHDIIAKTQRQRHNCSHNHNLLTKTQRQRHNCSHNHNLLAKTKYKYKITHKHTHIRSKDLIQILDSC